MGIAEAVRNIFASDEHAGRDFTLAGTLELQAAEPGSSELPRFSMIANTGRVPMILGGFRYPVVVDMQGVEFAKQSTPIIGDHDTAKRIGHAVEQSASVEAGIVALGVVSSESPAAREFLAEAKNRYPHEMSIGARAVKTDFVPEGKTVTVNATQFRGPVIVSRRTVIREFTVTTLGADSGTSVSLAASEQEHEIMATDIQADREQVAAEIERRDRINELFAQYEDITHVEGVNGQPIKASTYRAKVIREGTDPLKVENALIRAGLSGGAMERVTPAIHVKLPVSGTPLHSEALQCAALRAMGVPQSQENPLSGRRSGWEHQFNEQVLEAADSRELRDMSLHQLMQTTISAASGSYYGGNLKGDGFIAAYNDAARNLMASGGAFSTLTVNHILENVGNKMLQLRFELTPATWPLWCEQKNLSDFKPATLYRLDSNLGYLPLNPQGEIEHGKLVDSKRTVQADTKAIMISLDRHHIVNDDLDAFRQIMNGLADGATWAIEADVHATLLGNAGSFFDPANGNLISDPLGLTGLEEAEVAFDSHVGAGGKPIMASAEILLTGTSLAVTAKNLYTQTTLLGIDANASQIGVSNLYQGRFLPVKSKYIDVAGIRQPNGDAIPNQSASKWFLMAGANSGYAAVVVGLLHGRAVPTIQSAETSFNTLGMQWRGFHDFGTAQGDTQGAVMSTGDGGSVA